MLVCANDGGIDLQFFQVAFLKFCNDGRPSTALGPTIETLIDGVPVAEAYRQITPRNASFLEEEDGIDEESIIRSSDPAVACFAGEQCFDAVVLSVTQSMTSTRHSFFLQISIIDCQQSLKLYVSKDLYSDRWRAVIHYAIRCWLHKTCG